MRLQVRLVLVGSRIRFLYNDVRLGKALFDVAAPALQLHEDVCGCLLRVNAHVVVEIRMENGRIRLRSLARRQDCEAARRSPPLSGRARRCAISSSSATTAATLSPTYMTVSQQRAGSSLNVDLFVRMPRTSSPVNTMWTPGSAWAADASMRVMRAWAKGLRRILHHSIPGSAWSIPYLPPPVTLSGPSARGVALAHTIVFHKFSHGSYPSIDCTVVRCPVRWESGDRGNPDVPRTNNTLAPAFDRAPRLPRREPRQSAHSISWRILLFSQARR